MSDQEENTLKWGDIIRIHGVNVNKSEQEESKGLIVSKGYALIYLALLTQTSIIRNIQTSKMSTFTESHSSR